ncbi:MAG: hypothetical protein II892_07845 [Fibrobacter sp.]|jgi:hypothetical protein|nr:hypothetical protein [Fibrobacter sp.]
MSVDADELTIEVCDTETGMPIVKQLDKEILTKGAWQSMMFLYQDRDAKTGEFGEPKVSLRRYQKVQGAFKARSKFNISGKTQAEAIIATLKKWYNI